MLSELWDEVSTLAVEMLVLWYYGPYLEILAMVMDLRHLAPEL